MADANLENPIIIHWEVVAKFKSKPDEQKIFSPDQMDEATAYWLSITKDTDATFAQMYLYAKGLQQSWPRWPDAQSENQPQS